MLSVIISVCVIIILDQIFKYLSFINLAGGRTANCLFLEFSYNESNFILFGKNLNILMIIICMVILLAFVKFFFDYYTKSIKSKFNFIPFILVIGGGISNILDRIVRGFVIDYVTIPKIMNGTIFNLADACISVGIVLLIVYYLIRITEQKVQEDIEDGKNEDSSK